mmetsp:Transcript_84905/g.259240  ORF Transcript_84905/g.259240 Transcript_84905/m.259240 type:complete len:213 (-) Transcript_84905:1954-2592(-)
MDMKTYKTHRSTKNAAEAYLLTFGPPNSPPMKRRRTKRKTMATTANAANTLTLKAKLPALTTYPNSRWPSGPRKSNSTSCWYLALHSSWLSCKPQKIDAMVHGSPRPRKTLTELLPVTLPTDASASGSWTAACFEAKVSGKDVPRATKVMAVISFSMNGMTQPNRLAMSPMMTVTPPIMIKDTTKHSQPPHKSVGGQHAKTIFQGKLMAWRT